MKTLLLLLLFVGACCEERAPTLGDRCSTMAVELCPAIDTCGGIENNMYGCIEILEEQCCGPDSLNGSCDKPVEPVSDECLTDLDAWTCMDVFHDNIPESCVLPGYAYPNPWYDHN